MGAHRRDEAELRTFFELGKKLGLVDLRESQRNAKGLVEKLVKEYDVTFSIHNHIRDLRRLHRQRIQVWDPIYRSNGCASGTPVWDLLRYRALRRSHGEVLPTLRKIGSRLRSVH